MPTNLNHTIITLIPKIKSPQSIRDLRLISLCNVLYKLISKVLANGPKLVLPSMIHKTQSTFVLRRLTTDNTFVAFKMFDSMKKPIKSKKGE